MCVCVTCCVQDTNVDGTALYPWEQITLPTLSEPFHLLSLPHHHTHTPGYVTGVSCLPQRAVIQGLNFCFHCFSPENLSLARLRFLSAKVRWSVKKKTIAGKREETLIAHAVGCC